MFILLFFNYFYKVFNISGSTTIALIYLLYPLASHRAYHSNPQRVPLTPQYLRPLPQPLPLPSIKRTSSYSPDGIESPSYLREGTLRSLLSFSFSPPQFPPMPTPTHVHSYFRPQSISIASLSPPFPFKY